MVHLVECLYWVKAQDEPKAIKSGEKIRKCTQTHIKPILQMENMIEFEDLMIL